MLTGLKHIKGGGNMFKFIKRWIERALTKRKKDNKRERIEKLRADEHIFIEGKWF